MNHIARIATVAALASTALLLAAPAFAAGTIKVARSADIGADTAKTWATVQDFGGLHTWHPAVEKTEMKQPGDANKVGAIRVLSLKGGGALTEQLTQYSASAHSMSYKIIDGPLPVVGYVSTISVKPAKAGHSTIRWTSSFKAKEGSTDADAKKVIEGIYDAGFDNLKKTLGS